MSNLRVWVDKVDIYMVRQYRTTFSDICVVMGPFNDKKGPKIVDDDHFGAIYDDDDPLMSMARNQGPFVVQMYDIVH